MANTIFKLKRSGISGKVPSSLQLGELGLNYADGILYYSNTNSIIQRLNPSSNSFSTISVNSSLLLASSPTSILTISGNNGIIITGYYSNNNIVMDINNASTTQKGVVLLNDDVYSNSISFAATANSLSSVYIKANTAYNYASSKTYIFYQNTAPTSANSHDIWTNSDTGVVYENFGSISSPIWAEFGPTGVTTTGGITTLNNQLYVYYTPQTFANAAITISAANTKGGAGYADFLQLTNISGGATNPSKWIRLDSAGVLSIVNSAYTNTLLTLDDFGNLALAGNVTSSGVQSGYNANRPAFRVYGANTTGPLSTTQNGSGVLNSNNWAVDYNQGSYLNNSTGYFTAPVAGLYQINMNVRNAGNASYSQLICYKNSSTVMICVEFAGNSTMNHTGGSTVAKLAAGDTLIIKVAAGTVTFDGNDNWSVAYIG